MQAIGTTADGQLIGCTTLVYRGVCWGSDRGRTACESATGLYTPRPTRLVYEPGERSATDSAACSTRSKLPPRIL